MERELLLDALLERLTLFESERIGLGNNGNDVDNIGQLFQNDDIDRLETTSSGSVQKSFGHQNMNWVSSRMARGLDEEQAAMNTGILDVALTLSREFLAEVCRMLILDVLDNGIPADHD